MVRALGAVQAQDYAGAKWALSMRCGGATDAAIERELDAGRILRTHVLRPTWHFVAPEDIRWMLALTASRIAQVMSYYDVQLGLTPAVFRKSHRVIEQALAGGHALTRAELRERLERERINTSGAQRLARLMMRAELDALVCSGPRRGQQFTYALLDERAASTAPRERDDALGELATRYFRSRSPATAHDFAWWSGLTVADARRAIGILGAALERRQDGRAPVWLWADAARPPRSASAHLLPNYDEYFIGFRDRSAGAQRIGSAALITGGSALIAHIIVVDGQLVGGWRRVAEGGGVAVRARLLASLTAREQRLIAAQVKRLQRHLGVPVTMYSSS